MGSPLTLKTLSTVMERARWMAHSSLCVSRMAPTWRTARLSQATSARIGKVLHAEGADVDNARLKRLLVESRDLEELARQPPVSPGGRPNGGAIQRPERRGQRCDVLLQPQLPVSADAGLAHDLAQLGGRKPGGRPPIRMGERCSGRRSTASAPIAGMSPR